ncbi:MAG: murein L,D-transpeptidase catalytic domain family protein [Bacteroidota bacterium]
MKSLMFKKVYFFFSSLFIFLLHLPFVFAKTNPINKTTSTQSPQPVISTAVANTANVAANIYDSLRLGSLGLARQVFDYAMTGLTYMKEAGKVANENIISIVDFSKPSTQKRLYILDLKHYKVLFNTYVAHGMNSGQAFANNFSNIPESNQSSLGFYSTSGTYTGKNGYSMYLNGIEKGINDKAHERAIVMHGAPYVSEGMIRTKGYLGRSWGCPAVMEKLNKPIIDKIKNGTCLFIYSPNKNYLAHSAILKKRNYSSDIAYNN